MGTPDADEDGFVIYDFNPRNLPDDYLRAVGLVAMASAQTENVLSDFIGAVIGSDNIETMALTTHMSFPLKDNIIRSLIELNAATAEVVDNLDDILDSIGEAITKRNAIIHNPLIRHPETGEILSHRMKSRGSLQLALKPITVEEIQEDATLIYKAGMALQSFMMLYGLSPRTRKAQLREPLDRSKKARAKRRGIENGDTPK